MEKRLFFLRQDGWVEAQLSRNLLVASHEELARWAYAMTERHGYRNYMITENPQCIITGRAKPMIRAYASHASEMICKGRHEP